jgi:sulfatase maturation enzyme AslB (radical SAM superfamily)
MSEKPKFLPTLCITHECNLNCVYCYQNHDVSKMSFETAKACIDWIFSHIPSNTEGMEIDLIGGEPLNEFPLLKNIVEYTRLKYTTDDYEFTLLTNGTLLNDQMKMWFNDNKDKVVLGLSLDGSKETHDSNRNNSFDKIDIGFFVKTYSIPMVKMTLSEYSLPYLAENIEFIHSLGFKDIRGGYLYTGTFNWNSDKYIKILLPQLIQLVNFYVTNDSLNLPQVLDQNLTLCENPHKDKKCCDIGTGEVFFDVDGTRRLCHYITPMTFSQIDLKNIETTDFTNEENFVDYDCFNNCYIYPICISCPGADYLNNKTFKQRNKNHCRIQKLFALFIADLQAKRIAKNPAIYDNDKLYYIIEAIKKIREFYLPEFEVYFKE